MTNANWNRHVEADNYDVSTFIAEVRKIPGGNLSLRRLSSIWYENGSEHWTIAELFSAEVHIYYPVTERSLEAVDAAIQVRDVAQKLGVPYSERQVGEETQRLRALGEKLRKRADYANTLVKRIETRAQIPQ